MEVSKRRASIRMFAIALGLLGFLLAAEFALSPPRRALAAFPGRNGEIAFSAEHNLYPQIFVMRPDGTQQRILTHDYDYHFDPAISPNGKRITFERRSANTGYAEIWVVRSDGSNQHALTHGAFIDDRPAFSPNGRRLVFTRNLPYTGTEIDLMRADGSHVQTLIDGGGDPSFSQNGKRIYFHLRKEIHVIRADGSHQHAITHGPREAVQPAVSPNGTRIAFVRSHRHRQIYMMRADGTHQHRLTHNPANDDEPAFSPDGKRIVFERGVDPTHLRYEIYKMNADGSHQRPLANSAREPDWGPRP